MTGGDFRFSIPLDGINRGIYQVAVSNGELLVVECLICL